MSGSRKEVNPDFCFNTTSQSSISERLTFHRVSVDYLIRNYCPDFAKRCWNESLQCWSLVCGLSVKRKSLSQSCVAMYGFVVGQQPSLCSIIQALQIRQRCFTDWGMCCMSVCCSNQSGSNVEADFALVQHFVQTLLLIGVFCLIEHDALRPFLLVKSLFKYSLLCFVSSNFTHNISYLAVIVLRLLLYNVHFTSVLLPQCVAWLMRKVPSLLLLLLQFN